MLLEVIRLLNATKERKRKKGKKRKSSIPMDGVERVEMHLNEGEKAEKVIIDVFLLLLTEVFVWRVFHGGGDETVRAPTIAFGLENKNWLGLCSLLPCSVDGS